MQADRRTSTLLRATALTAVSLAVLAGGLAIVFALLPDVAAQGLDTLCRWDCIWYDSIASPGYQIDPGPKDLQANYAFYPAFPLATGLVMLATGLTFTHAALLLNAVNALLFAWLALANRDVLLLRNDRDAAVFVLAFLLSPWSLYNHVPYTEMTFNLAALAAFVSWQRGYFAAAALCGAVLTATRVTGIFLPIMLMLELLVRERGQVLGLLRAPDARFRALAIMPLGAFAFFIYLGLHVGDPLASFRIQMAWNQGLRDPLEALAGGLGSGTQPLIAVLAFVAAVLLLIAGWRRHRIPIALAGTGLLVVGTTVMSGLLSLPRHALAFFPVYLMVPALPRPMQWILLGVFAVVQCIFLYHWVLGARFLI